MLITLLIEPRDANGKRIRELKHRRWRPDYDTNFTNWHEFDF